MIDNTIPFCQYLPEDADVSARAVGKEIKGRFCTGVPVLWRAIQLVPNITDVDGKGLDAF